MAAQVVLAEAGPLTQKPSSRPGLARLMAWGWARHSTSLIQPIVALGSKPSFAGIYRRSLMTTATSLETAPRVRDSTDAPRAECPLSLKRVTTLAVAHHARVPGTRLVIAWLTVICPENKPWKERPFQFRFSSGTRGLG